MHILRYDGPAINVSVGGLTAVGRWSAADDVGYVRAANWHALALLPSLSSLLLSVA